MFRNYKSRKAFDTLNSKHKIWAEHAVVLDEIDPAIWANFVSKRLVVSLRDRSSTPDRPD